MENGFFIGLTIEDDSFSKEFLGVDQLIVPCWRDCGGWKTNYENEELHNLARYLCEPKVTHSNRLPS